MISPFKLLKSKKWFDLIESDVKGMTMRNWKTNLSGILFGLCMLGKIWAPAPMISKIDATEGALVVIGLISAKDSTNHSTVAETKRATIDEKL